MELKGSLVTMWLSSTDSNYKAIICEKDSRMADSAEVTSVDTKTCGRKTIVGIPGTEISGSGVVDNDPAENQASYKQLRTWLLARTPLYYIYKTLADSSAGETSGESVYSDGQGYLSQLEVTSDANGLIEFTWSFTTTGTQDSTSDS